MKHQIDFWFEFASTYSYPAAMRIEEEAGRRGIAINWRPFLLGPIFFEQGWTDSPFNLYPAKGKYMWRDLERICAAHGLALNLPPRKFPQNGLKAARIALIAATQDWAPRFIRGVYEANFVHGADIYDIEVLTQLLHDLGQNPEMVLEQAFSPANKAALADQTEQARAAGIFGAPSFTVGPELFWGHDRLIKALEWAKQGQNA